MVDLLWKDVALALLAIGWGGVCWWCGRIQSAVDTLRSDISTLREQLPHYYVVKSENSEHLRRIEDKLDRIMEKMIP